MLTVNLSTLAIVLGLVVVALNIGGVIKPTAFGAALRKFPRYTPIGYPLVLLATFLFIYNVSLESVSDFASFKPILYTLFAAVGIGTCLFVSDYLPVRGLAVLLLVLAKLMVDSARWSDTPWRLVITTWAYVWIVLGMWFTISPWRLRDIILWATADPNRTRMFSGVRLALGVLVLVLGLTVYRTAESKSRVTSTVEHGPVSG